MRITSPILVIMTIVLVTGIGIHGGSESESDSASTASTVRSLLHGAKLPPNVARAAFPKKPLNVSISIALPDSHHIQVISDGKLDPRFSSEPEQMTSNENGFLVDENTYASTFFAYISDQELKNDVRLAKPNLFAFDNTVNPAIVEWDTSFKVVPFVSHDELKSDPEAGRIGVPFTIKYACLAKGQSRIVVHVSFVPVPPEFSAAPTAAADGSHGPVTPIVKQVPARHLLQVPESEEKPKVEAKIDPDAHDSNVFVVDKIVKGTKLDALSAYHRMFSFSFVKQCGGATDQLVHSRIPGLDILTLSDLHEGDVISDGAVKPPFNIVHLDEAAQDKAQWSKAASIGPNSLASVFYVRIGDGSKRIVTMHTPVATTRVPTICNPTISGTLAQAESQISETVQQFIITYQCLSEGSTPVTISFHTNEGEVAFSFIKECPGGDGAVSDVQGTGVPGLIIGTKSGLNDVVDDGFTQAAYRQPLNVMEEEGAADTDSDSSSTVTRLIIPEAVSQTTFHVELTSQDGEATHYRRPIVFADSVDDIPMAFPVLAGSMMRTSAIPPHHDDSDMLDLIVRHKCYRQGAAEITVTIPLEPAGEVKFSFIKRCSDHSQSMDVDDMAGAGHASTATVLGFHAGTSEKTPDDVISNGKVTKAYTWSSGSSDTLYALDSDTNSFSLSLTYTDGRFRDSGKEYDMTHVELEKPSVVCHHRLCNVELTGQASEGFKFNSPRRPYSVKGGSKIMARVMPRHATLGFTFHCTDGGSSLVTIVLPVILHHVHYVKKTTAGESDTIASDDAEYEQLVLTLVKHCPYDVVEQGGVTLPGFYIGVSPGSADVVSNGFPMGAYFGQRLKEKPSWGPALVPANEDSRTFYLTYSDPDGDEELQYDSPIVIQHSSAFEIELSGSAASGGKLRNVGNSTHELTVNFNCRFDSTGAATVVLPVKPHGKIMITIPKECSGKQRPSGMKLTGLMVSTKIHEADVVAHGHTDKHYSIYKPGRRGDRRLVSAAEEETIYFIERFNALRGMLLLRDRYRLPPLQIYEPVVFAHRPICNPSIKHDLPHSVVREVAEHGKLSEKLVDAETLQVSTNPSTFNISYNCVWPGTTPITVSFAVYPRGQVSFTWTKVCSLPEGYGDDDEDNDDALSIGDGSSSSSSDAFAEADEDDEEARKLSIKYGQNDGANEVGGDTPVTVTDESDEPGDDNSSSSPAPNDTEQDSNSNSDSSSDESDLTDSEPSQEVDYDLEPGQPQGANFGDDDDDEWSDFDEVHAVDPDDIWDRYDHNDQDGSDSAASTGDVPEISEPAIGYINAGLVAGRSDIIENGRAHAKFAMPSARSKNSRLGFNIDEEEDGFTFYLSVPHGHQLVGVPDVRATHNGVCSPAVISIFGSTQIRVTTEPTPVTISFRCNKPGAAAVLVYIPYVPLKSGSAAFRVTKICGGFKPVVEDTVTASSAMSFMFVIAIGAAVAIGYKVFKKQNPQGLRGFRNFRMV
jgi:hypothetical protein